MSTPRTLQIDKEFRDLLPTLTAEESAALEESIEREGCRDALIVWGDTLVDGHNRHEICTRRGFPFQVRQMEFDSREDVIIWICANQNARRNITPEQKAYLVGKRYEAEKKKAGAPDGNRNAQKQRDHNGPIVCVQGGRTYERVAKEAGVGVTTVKRSADYARAVDTLATDSPTIKHKILSGEINQSRAAIVEIAAKPEAERKAAVERMERGDPPVPEVTTKVCCSCGRELPLNQFTYLNYGKRLSSRCRQCERSRCAGGDARSVRADMQALENITSAMYGEGDQPEYTIDDLLGEIRRGGESVVRLITNAFDVHTDIVSVPENVRAINALIESISGDIYNTRRG